MEQEQEAGGTSSGAATEKQKRKHCACQKRLQKVLRKSPYVRYMMEHMKKIGCEVIPEKHIVCEPCSPPIVGGYDPRAKQIVICENYANSQGIMRDALTHELIHAYDDCRAHVDWDNLHHLACTEIRAANLSTECFFWKETFGRFSFGLFKHQQDCVKYRAMKSIQCIKNVTQDEAMKAVNDVFEQCFRDTVPFERVPP